ncbi:ABC transporter ATP-binding protein [Candidatus Margulisiibacteriota bacterium]
MFVKVQNVKKEYGVGNARIMALDDISFSFKEREFLAVSGPSGGGKTTLLTVMAGLQRPNSGKVIIDNMSIYEQFDSDGLAVFRNEYIGFVFQSFHLIPYLNSLQNVMLPLAHKDLTSDEKVRMAKTALKKMGLADRMAHLPTELSGGQNQRVAIARALVNNPKIVFADEPTGNLDTNTRDEILGVFREMTQDYTVVMVTHDKENIRQADRVVKIKDGKIIE